MKRSRSRTVTRRYPRRNVVVNGRRLDPEVLGQLERDAIAQIRDGDYWYDFHSGLWGIEGQPASGRMMPLLTLGGPLSPRASRGDSAVHLNGRELTRGERARIEQLLGEIAPGRYFLDEDGYCGFELGPRLLNLLDLMGWRAGALRLTAPIEPVGCAA